MDAQASALALKNALNEIKNMCPGVSHIFVLDENQHALAQDQDTTEELTNGVADSLTAMVKRAEIAGGIESLTYEGSDQRINLARYDDNYLVTVASNEAAEKAVSNVTRVLIPTLLKFVKDASSNQVEKDTIETPPVEISPEVTPEAPTNDVPASECVVETLSGLSILSVSPGTIRVDRALIGEWKELYGDKKIEEAEVEAVSTGKRTRCKFQPIKNSKLEGQGVVQLPDKVQQTLEIKKGTVVLVRPVVED